MKHAYSSSSLQNLYFIKEIKRWKQANIISAEQSEEAIKHSPSDFYHPNIFIRVLLFIATLIGLGGVTGMVAVLFSDVKEDGMGLLCFVYGAASFLFTELVVINRLKHYKSGVTEALLYHAGGFLLLGILFMLDFDFFSGMLVASILCACIAYRYLDLVSTLLAFLVFFYLIFSYINEFHAVAIVYLPFIVFALSFILYLVVKRIQKYRAAFDAQYVLWLVESLALVMLYVSVNYFVVRELSVALLGLSLQPGDDIPFASLFYSLTILLPILYLWIGLKKKDTVMYRISLLVLAFTVFTFKYYFSFNRPEVTLTVSGLILIAIGLFLFRWLRQPKYGFTTEELLKENWNSQLVQSVLVSQTLGGNKIPDKQFEGGGGTHGGGGSSGSF
ncbi:MAG: hypothetical protein O9302_13155 [Cyclobacteriaceae bacterium]|jgi:hypothetical protein|nr:hypothetical protein [Flammeovirgaceae bacterium]MCZ8020925.1 hypothetical protein [Cytophagales bacterium]MCZ8329007.1 hypothetical protein [Cyclobacteriaceae bacterium]